MGVCVIPTAMGCIHLKSASARGRHVPRVTVTVKGYCRRHGFDPWVGKIPWRRKWLPTPVFLPGRSHRQRSLVRYTPWGRKESDTTEHTHMPEPQSWNWRITCVFSFVSKIFLAGDAGSLTVGKLGLRGAGGDSVFTR